MTAILSAFVIGAIWGLVTGLRLKHRRFLTVREQLRDATQRISAWKLADTKGDLDVVGSVTGPTKTVELFDGAQLAEWREQAEHVCTYECAGQGCNDPQPERPCNGCGKAARFAWDDDGVPRAACNFCVSLWFEDGLPAHVRRISDDGSADAEDDPATFPRPLFGGRGRR